MRPFEGATPFVIALGLVFVAAALGAPRRTAPRILPLPEPRRATLARKDAEDHARVERVREHALPFSARAVGEGLRRWGAAVAARSGDAPRLLASLRGLVRVERAQGRLEQLLDLRAVQTELFVAATHAWDRTGRIDTELEELGGDFAELAQSSGWLDGRRLVLDDDERALLFRARWNELTGLADTVPFAPTLDEERARYALLLRHPAGPDAERRLAHALGYVAALEKLDRDYPANFARGVLLFRAEAYEASADAFRAQLAAHPDGPWTLRAKNHLLEALAETPGRD